MLQDMRREQRAIGVGGSAFALGVAMLLVGGCAVPTGGTVHTAVDRAAPGRSVRSAEDRSPQAESTPAESPAEPDWPDGILTLDAARMITVRDNPDLDAARARLAGAVAQIDQALARYYPTITFRHTTGLTTQTARNRPQLTSVLSSVEQLPSLAGTADPLQNVNPLFRPFLRPLFGTPTLGSNSQAFTNNSTGLTASWTAFDGFIREARIEAAKYARSAAAHSLADVRRLLVHATDTAYFQVQLAREELRIARADEVYSREQLEETEKLRNANRASLTDVQNFRVRLLAAQADVTAAIGSRDAGRVVLAELMGIPGVMLPNDLELAPLTDESDEEMTVPDADLWLQRAVANRPDLEQLDALLSVDQQNVRATDGLFSPSVALSGTWGLDRDGSIEYSSNDQASGGAVEVRWELFTGGSREARRRVARSAVAEASANLRRARLTVESQVRQAVVALADAQGRIRLQRENLTTALDNRRAIRAAYSAGRETLTRLNQAQRDVLEADAGLSSARIRLRRAWSDLYSAASAYPTELIDAPPNAGP